MKICKPYYDLVDEARIKEVGVDRAAAEWVLRLTIYIIY